MKCNDLRLLANELMFKIYKGKFSKEERIAQLEILRKYASAAIKEIKKEKGVIDD